MDPLPLSLDLDVDRRLADLRSWTATWQAEDLDLRQRLADLNPARRADVLLGSQIGSLRRALALRINDTPDPQVTGFGGWGRWPNGGSGRSRSCHFR